MNRKVLLMILDGWGEGEHNWTNAIYTQGAPYIDSLRAKYPTGHLQACGEYVGLPDGQMGNSEVGHLNLGAGRVVYQDLVKINMACRDHKLLDNKEIKAAYDYVAKTGKQLHFMGLASMGGVHSSLEHVYEFLAVAKQYNLDKVFVHCFMDGRDTDPKSGKGFVEELEKKMAETTGKVASVCGRYYAMDRDKRWERVKLAYDLLVKGEGAKFTSGETVAKAGKRQLRIAETEKYAHVTFFFNGGREDQFENEDRILVKSPKVPTYDLLPEMSAQEVTEKLVEVLKTGKEDMIILNFANGDMVGHTGVFSAICRAVAKVDKCVREVVETAVANDYVVLLTADHGNADHAYNADGSPNTAHSLNPVQFIVINAGVEHVKDGKLADVAPTILKLMGIPQPEAMTGEPLV